MKEINIDNIIKDFFWESWYRYDGNIIFDLVYENLFDYIYINCETKVILELWKLLSWSNIDILNKKIKNGEKERIKYYYDKYNDKILRSIKDNFKKNLEEILKGTTKIIFDVNLKDAFIFLYWRIRKSFWIHIWWIYKNNWVTICPYCNFNEIILTDKTLYSDIDHILPKFDKFWLSISLNNIIICCSSCNRFDKCKTELDPECNPLDWKSISENFIFCLNKAKYLTSLNKNSLYDFLDIHINNDIDEGLSCSIWNYLWIKGFDNEYVSFYIYAKYAENFCINTKLCIWSQNWKSYIKALSMPWKEKFYDNIDSNLFQELKDDYSDIWNFHNIPYFKLKYDLIFNQK